MILSKTEFDNLSAKLCGRMVSLDKTTRRAAADDAEALLADLPKDLKNSPHCKEEISTIRALIGRVRA
jgi:hypothetical protein